MVRLRRRPELAPVLHVHHGELHLLGLAHAGNLNLALGRELKNGIKRINGQTYQKSLFLIPRKNKVIRGFFLAVFCSIHLVAMLNVIRRSGELKQNITPCMEIYD